MCQHSGLTLRHLDARTARDMRDDVARIYSASYVEAIASGDPFDSIDTFMHRFDIYAQSPTFDMIIAYFDDSPVGQTWGWPLQENAAKSGWWSGLLESPEPGFTVEDGRRTFALSEIMVDQRRHGGGIAHVMHDELLRHRTEARATLLVEPHNVHARRAYQHWGWRPVAQLRPHWENAPLFDVMVIPLPIAPGRPE